MLRRRRKLSRRVSKYSAFDTAIYYLTFKDRTKREIEDKLKEKGYGEEEIDEAVARLMGYGYINDKGYTLSYIKSNIEKKGRRLIVRELLNKGIEKDTIEQYMEEADIDEYTQVENILIKKYSTADFNDISDRRKIFSYFARRGYGFDVINKAITNYINTIKNN